MTTQQFIWWAQGIGGGMVVFTALSVLWLLCWRWQLRRTRRRCNKDLRRYLSSSLTSKP